MKKSGLADSPLFTKSGQKKKITPPSETLSQQKEKKEGNEKQTKTKSIVDQSTDRPTDRLTDQSTDRLTDRPIDQPTDKLTDVDALGPVVDRPRSFYITQRVDQWLNEAVRYLKEKGMDIQTAELSSGAVQIHASERQSTQSDGTAEIRTQVNIDGTLWVDINKIKGSRCEEIVDDLADAVGGQVAVMRKKDSYYQLPGEPTKVRTKI